EWLARYYHHPLGEVLATALPAALRQAQAAERSSRRVWRALPAAASADDLARAPLQQALLAAIRGSAEAVAHSELLARWPTAAQPLRRLAERGLIESAQQPFALPRGSAGTGPELNSAQQAVLSKAGAAGDGF